MRQSFAARMAAARRDAILARLTESAHLHDDSVRAVVDAALALIASAEAGEVGATLVAEVGTKGRIHVKRLRPSE